MVERDGDGSPNGFCSVASPLGRFGSSALTFGDMGYAKVDAALNGRILEFMRLHEFLAVCFLFLFMGMFASSSGPRNC